MEPARQVEKPADCCGYTVSFTMSSAPRHRLMQSLAAVFWALLQEEKGAEENRLPGAVGTVVQLPLRGFLLVYPRKVEKEREGSPQKEQIQIFLACGSLERKS